MGNRIQIKMPCQRLQWYCLQWQAMYMYAALAKGSLLLARDAVSVL